MPTVPLPDRPSLEQLKKQAKDLRHAVRAADGLAGAQVAEFHPDWPAALAAVDRFTLSGAQLVVARRYGFAGWPALAAYVRSLTHEWPEPAGRASEFLRLACRPQIDEIPERWSRACALLTAHPEIAGEDVHVAAAAADVSQLRKLLAADRGSADSEGGPFGWPPLLYLVCARHDPAVSAERIATAAQVLVRAGADLGASREHEGVPYPITVLTGLLGGVSGLHGHQESVDVSPLRHPLAPELLPMILGGFVYTPEAGYRPYRLRDPEPTPDIERCKRAATSAHPDPEAWQLITSTRSGGVEAIAFRTPEGLLFCELTPTTVTLSPPVPTKPPVGWAALAFHTGNGTVAGVVSAEIRGMLTLGRTVDAGRVKGKWVDAGVTDGVFLAANALTLAGSGLILGSRNGDEDEVVMPAEALPAPAAGSVDRPGPPIEAGSPAAERLRACLAQSTRPPVVNADNWVPGLYMHLAERHSIQLGRYGSLLALGHLHPDAPTRVHVEDLGRRHPSRRVCVGTTVKAIGFHYDFKTDPESGGSISNTRALAGLVDDERVASITLSCTGLPETEAVIEDGTFIVKVPTLSGVGATQLRLLVKDRAGTVIEDLPCAPVLL